MQLVKERACSYLLVIEVVKAVEAQVGRLGILSFPPGIYCYVGSASRNTQARLRRHLQKEKRIFWHIDYLLSQKESRIREIWVSDKRECDLSRTLLRTGRFVPVKGFGSSDCSCPAHLFRLESGSARFSRSLHFLTEWPAFKPMERARRSRRSRTRSAAT